MRKRKKTVIAIVAAALVASAIGLGLLNLVTVDYLAEVETYAPENVRALALAVIKAERRSGKVQKGRRWLDAAYAGHGKFRMADNAGRKNNADGKRPLRAGVER